MAKRHKPMAGSRAYTPRKRAKQQKPRLRSWPTSEKQTVCGFAGYKAGMTYVLALDNRQGRATTGLEVFIPATVIDAPPLNVFGFRAYRKGYEGVEAVTDVLHEKAPADLKKRLLSLPKKSNPQEKIKQVTDSIKDITDVRLLVSTQPSLTSIGQKKPDVMEIGLSGSVEEKLKYATEQLGKQLSVKNVFADNTFVDVTAVTKGKGFQGIIKRYGIGKQPRKSTQKIRHIGSGGSITPSKKLWMIPQPGQHGYHTRTEYNKAVLKVGADGKEVTPEGGFLNYGPVNGDYIILKGSIPGPAKRVIRLTVPRRQKEDANYTLSHIDLASKQGVA